MTSFLARRLVRSLVLLFLTLTLVFVLFRIVPGGLEYTVSGGLGTTAEIQRIRVQLGLDKPLFTQYLRYLNDLLRGDLGYSFVLQQPVVHAIFSRLPASLLLLSATIGLVLIGATTLGLSAGITGRTSILFPAFVVYSIPHFALGLLLVSIFSVQLRLLPGFGLRSAASLIMPSIATAMPLITVNARLIAASVMEEGTKEHVRTARAKGLTERRVLFKHIFRGASLPVLTSVGMQVGYLLGGHVVIETVFSWPGIGLLLIQSAKARDYPTVQALTILLTAGFLVVNTMVDLLYAALDPRIRLD